MGNSGDTILNYLYAEHKFQAVAKELAGDIREVNGAHLA